MSKKLPESLTLLVRPKEEAHYPFDMTGTDVSLSGHILTGNKLNEDLNVDFIIETINNNPKDNCRIIKDVHQLLYEKTPTDIQTLSHVLNKIKALGVEILASKIKYKLINNKKLTEKDFFKPDSDWNIF